LPAKPALGFADGEAGELKELKAIGSCLFAISAPACPAGRFYAADQFLRWALVRCQYAVASKQ
jgi:hypothetical protein